MAIAKLISGFLKDHWRPMEEVSVKLSTNLGPLWSSPKNLWEFQIKTILKEEYDA